MKRPSACLQSEILCVKPYMNGKCKVIITITAILAFGAVLNVVFAWGVATRLPFASPSVVKEAPIWACPPPSAVSKECILFGADDWVRHGAGWDECRAERHYLDKTSGYPLFWNEDSLTLVSGWPLRALRYVDYTATANAPFDRSEESSWFRDGILMPAWALKAPGARRLIQNHRLPLEPLPGFVVNTIFYAVILAVPLSVRPIRRHIRARRGKCVKCGYDLAGAVTDACPECGTRISRVQRS